MIIVLYSLIYYSALYPPSSEPGFVPVVSRDDPDIAPDAPEVAMTDMLKRLTVDDPMEHSMFLTYHDTKCQLGSQMDTVRNLRSGVF